MDTSPVPSLKNTIKAWWGENAALAGSFETLRRFMNLTDSEYYAYANTQRLPRGVYRTGRRALASVNVNF